MRRGEPLSRNMGSALPVGTSSVPRTEQPRLHSSQTSHEAVRGGARGQCVVYPGGCPRDSAEPGAGPLRRLPGTRGAPSSWTTYTSAVWYDFRSGILKNTQADVGCMRIFPTV